MTSAAHAGQPKKIRFGYTMAQFLLINILPFALIGLLWYFGVFDSVPWLPWTLLAAIVLLNFSFGATLNGTHLVVHNVRRRRIPWTDIASITKDRNLNQRTVVVTEHSGRETRLRVPTTGPFAWDPKFDQKYNALVDWYHAHR